MRPFKTYAASPQPPEPQSKSLKKLATPPPFKKPLAELAELNGQVAVMQHQLGLPHTLPTLDAKRLIARIAELQTMGAAAPRKEPELTSEPAITARALETIAPAVAATVAALPPTAPGILQASLVDFRKMDAATRLQFSQDGGALAQADFNQLSALAKMQHCRAGGKILESAETSNRAVAPGHAAVTPHP